jgi:hypothetical protein
MDQVTLLIIGSLLEERALREVLPVLAVLLSLIVDALLLFILNTDRWEIDRLLGAGIQGNHCELASHHYVFGRSLFAFLRSFRYLQSDLH